MFRTLMVCAVAGALTLGIASIASAQPPLPFPQPQPFPQRPLPQFPRAPHGPVLPAPHGEHYHVLYRTCEHDPWRTYGTYDCHELAHEIADRLKIRGLQARVVHH